MDYRIWALLSAVFAGATALLSKKGVEDVPTNLAIAVRVFFVFALTVGLAAITGETGVATLTRKAWQYLFWSAVATGLSWQCYFHAIKLGPISKVAPIDKLSFVFVIVLGILFLGETFTWKLAIGTLLVIAGVLVTLS